MMNLMEINGYSAVIKYDPEIEMLRGEFIGLNGSADFYANNIEDLKKEGAISLKIFVDACQKRNIEPRKKYSGKVNVRVPSKLHANITSAAIAEGKSLNRWVVDTLDNAAQL